MHEALRSLDILDIIFDFVLQKRNQHATLGSCARVSKSWSQPALRNLWSGDNRAGSTKFSHQRFSGLSSMVARESKVLPSCWSRLIPSNNVPQRNEPDFSRPLKYASYMKALVIQCSVSTCDHFRDFCYLLSICSTPSNTLPSLRTLELYVDHTESESEIRVAISTFMQLLNPSLSKLTINVIEEADCQGLLGELINVIAQRCSGLRSFSFLNSDKLSTRKSAVPSNAINRLINSNAHLEHLELKGPHYPGSTAELRAIALLPYLRSVKLEVALFKGSLFGDAPQGGFSHLQNMSLTGRANTLRYLLANVPEDAPLSHLDLSSSFLTPKNVDTQERGGIFPPQFCPKGLRKLELRLHSFSDCSASIENVLAGITRFKNIRDINIHSDIAICVGEDELLTAISACNLLEIFTLHPDAASYPSDFSKELPSVYLIAGVLKHCKNAVKIAACVDLSRSPPKTLEDKERKPVAEHNCISQISLGTSYFSRRPKHDIIPEIVAYLTSLVTYPFNRDELTLGDTSCVEKGCPPKSWQKPDYREDQAAIFGACVHTTWKLETYNKIKIHDTESDEDSTVDTKQLDNFDT
jgi:hypothetical protein